MKDPQQIYDGLFTAYHNPSLMDSMQGIINMLEESGPEMKENPHYKWLYSTSFRFIEEFAGKKDHELPGMLYGMIYSAIQKFTEDYKIKYQKYQDQITSREKELVSDADVLTAWLLDRAWELFQDKNKFVELFTIGDLINEISFVTCAEVVKGEKIELGIFTPESVTKLLAVAKRTLQNKKLAMIGAIDPEIRYQLHTLMLGKDDQSNP